MQKSNTLKPKKILTITGIILMQGILLYFFYINQYPILNFKFSYLTKLYVPIYVSEIQGLFYRTLGLPEASSSDMLQSNKSQEPFARSVPVLLYHGSVENADKTNIHLEDFRDHMFALYRAGYRTITMREFQEFMDGKRKLPAKSFLLTFDDGRKDSFYPVDPILKALDYSAVMFVITAESLGEETNPFHLHTDELHYLLRTGRWDIEAHGHDSHRTYPIDGTGNTGTFIGNRLFDWDKGRVETEKEFEERVYRDLLISRNMLREEFGVPITSFAFPFGDYGQVSINHPGAEQTVERLANSLYRFSFRESAFPDSLRMYPDAKTHYVDRIDVRPDWTSEYLITLLERSEDKPLPFADNFSTDTGWIPTAGEVVPGNGLLVLRPGAATGAAWAVLEGTWGWDNYRLRALIAETRADLVSVTAHETPDTSILCTFTQKGVALEERSQDGYHVIAFKPYGSAENWGKHMQIGIDVQGKNVRCIRDNVIVVSGTSASEELILRGRTGIKMHGAITAVEDISVTPIAP